MPKPKAMNETRCPACGHPDLDDLLLPYCSLVCRRLGRLGLDWRPWPYRIVVASHPYLIVQAGPGFDLRESVLRGARDRALATERKRGQRARLRTSPMSRAVTPTEQHSAVIQGPDDLLGVEKIQSNLGGVLRDA